MKQLEEENKILIQLSNNYFNALLLINSGIVGLLLNFNSHNYIYFVLLLLGFYFDFWAINRFQNIQAKLKENLKGFSNVN